MTCFPKLSFAVDLMVSCFVYRAELVVVDHQPEPDVRAVHRPRTGGCGDCGHIQVYTPLQVTRTVDTPHTFYETHYLAIYIIL